MTGRGCRLLGIAMIGLASCSAQEPGPFSGRYEGSEDGFFGFATLELQLYQIEGRIEGTWSRSESTMTDTGQIAGTLRGTSIAACLTDGAGTPFSCISQLNGQIRGVGEPGTTISGRITYVPRPGLGNVFKVTKR